ncbi:MAG: hypothetical protein AAGG01_13040 [Planctomycetota bacterium]
MSANPSAPKRFSYRMAPLRGTVHLEVEPDQVQLLNGQGEVTSSFRLAGATSARFCEHVYRGIDMLRLDVHSEREHFRAVLHVRGLDPANDESARQFLAGAALLLQRLQAESPRLRVELGGGPFERAAMLLLGLLSLLTGLGFAAHTLMEGAGSGDVIELMIGSITLSGIGLLAIASHPPGSKAPKLRPRVLAKQLLERAQAGRHAH